MAKTKNVFLVGPMGAGKSTIGRQLSRGLGVPFHDSDKEIEERTGVDIPRIFDVEKEAGFRKRERAVIEDLSKLDGIVLATGGGAILDKRNRQNLAKHGKVIYLHTTVDQQLRRTRRDRNRPLLQTDNPRKILEDLMAVRDPLYREVANMVIETDGRTVKQVVKEILESV